jgi:hypothetical protein
MQGTPRALGIAPHTGWAACVVVGGTLAEPEILANEIVRILDDTERFCYHMAEGMDFRDAVDLIARTRKKAVKNAQRALSPLVAGASVCAIVARDRDPGSLEHILAAHPRIHTAEGCFYRDVFREACGIPTRIVAPGSLDPARVGKLAGPPWGRDQRMAALAGWTVLGT